MAGGGEATEEVSGRGLDQVGQAERSARLHDQDRAQLSGPRVDVLEDRPVERAQVVEVVPARQPAALQLVRPHGGEPPFRVLQLSPVGQAEAVAEDAGTGIQVRVAGHFR
jgi:hypothetical protein